MGIRKHSDPLAEKWDMGIYVIWPVGRKVVKIGESGCIEKRIAQLQTASPDRLIRIADSAPFGQVGEDRIFHRQFAASRIRGEWFQITPEICDWIKDELAVRYWPDWLGEI